MDSTSLKEIGKEFCYQHLCQGDPKWPTGVIYPEDLDEDSMKDIIMQEFQAVKKLITDKVTLNSLSVAPEKVYKCLKYILKYYEDEHSLHHPYDVRRLTLPRLFNPLPSPSLHWRFITVSVNALYTFVKKPYPKGYVNQLALFREVFNIGVLNYRYVLRL